MIALGSPSVHRGGPTLGRRYVEAPLKGSIMAKLAKAVKRTVLGLTSSSSGTYIRPHEAGGYSFGRWFKCHVTGGYRYERLGDRSTVDGCREALEAVDKAVERRSKQLNKRKQRRD